MEPIITAKNIGKRYNINHQQGGYVALRDVITNAVKSPLKFLKSKVKQVTGIDTKEEFWALRDVNFEINKGEVVGIIGHNGAGKSTLLKILSQITPPTTGEIKINGRVGSLLEVGTGFHPELTGRENIFLNGAILGMKKSEIVKKFDEIIKFADIEKFLDTPVKYYSSGMYVRLAFSVAAHMETDILIIDEVLAVGDSEFQKKCLGKMEDITQNEGRTILFVSHNIQTVKELCTKCILMEDGKVKEIGPTDRIVNLYQNKKNNTVINNRSFAGPLSKILEFTKININNSDTTEIESDKKIELAITGISKEDIDNLQITISIYKDDIRLFTLFDTENPEDMKSGEFKSVYTIEPNILREGVYSIALGGHTSNSGKWMYGLNIYDFRVVPKFSNINNKEAVGIINIPHTKNRIQ
ncbi:MAG: ABC transporter ATP-binding protein [Candidatus Paceibacterota bacterium]